MLVRSLLAGKDRLQAYVELSAQAALFFADSYLEKELAHYHRILGSELAHYQEQDIQSSGYVVHSLEAAVWCFLTTSNYRDAVVKAVNLGLDTDSIGAITGGLAGICYGVTDIPAEWLGTIIQHDAVMLLCEKFADKVAT